MSASESELPLQSGLWRVSEFRSALQDMAKVEPKQGERTGLKPSLLADLQRREDFSSSLDLLEVLAACVRHRQEVVIYIARDQYIVPLTVFPYDNLYYCPLYPRDLFDAGLKTSRLLRLEASQMSIPGQTDGRYIGTPELYRPLRLLLWGTALRGPRNTLLPELAGPAVYRVRSDFEISGLFFDAAHLQAIQRLIKQVAPLRVIAQWPGFDEEHAVRFLNTLYLLSGLIISRTHPAALSEEEKAQDWKSMLRDQSAESESSTMSISDTPDTMPMSSHDSSGTAY